MDNNKKTSGPYLIGITGGFGTGKSLTGEILEAYGITVIDTDEIVKTILSTKNNITERIKIVFGDIVINKDKENYIDKQALAQIIFSNKNKRKELEAIIHPEVNKVLQAFVSLNNDKKLIAVLIPLLFESGRESFYNEIWCINCNRKIQLERLLKKGFTPEEIDLRINAQLPIETKIEKSDFIVDNSGSEDETKKQITLRLKELAQSNHNLHLSLDI